MKRQEKQSALRETADIELSGNFIWYGKRQWILIQIFKHWNPARIKFYEEKPFIFYPDTHFTDAFTEMLLCLQSSERETFF